MYIICTFHSHLFLLSNCRYLPRWALFTAFTDKKAALLYNNNTQSFLTSPPSGLIDHLMQCFLSLSFILSHLSVHFHGGSSAELTAGQIGIVTGVDVVVSQRLIHVLVDVQPVQEHGSVFVGHQVIREAFLADDICNTESNIHCCCSRLAAFGVVGGG